MATSVQRKRNGALIIKGALPQIRKDAARLGQMMVDEGTSIIKAEFVTDRPSHRRRDNSVRLVNALTYKVTEAGDDVSVSLTIKPGVSAVKVAVMNNGAREHDITPRTGGLLIFPAPRLGQRGSFQIGTRRRGAGNAFTNAYSSDRSGRAKRVRHPGRSRTARGTKFMQRARRRALDRLR